MSFEIDGLNLVRIPSNFLMSFDYRVKEFFENDNKQWQGSTLA